MLIAAQNLDTSIDSNGLFTHFRQVSLSMLFITHCSIDVRAMLVRTNCQVCEQVVCYGHKANVITVHA